MVVALVGHELIRSYLHRTRGDAATAGAAAGAAGAGIADVNVANVQMHVCVRVHLNDDDLGCNVLLAKNATKLGGKCRPTC